MLLDFLPELNPDSPQGTIGRLPLEQLRPTQNAVGMDEVAAKARKMADMNERKLEGYLLQRPVPIILGNESDGPGSALAAPYYMIDHHHLAAALWAARQDPQAPVFAEVRRNWRPLVGDRFWKAMASNNWLYAYNGMGAGPTSPAFLKPTVMELENDIYRISWVVREAYGYVKDPQNPTFAEFKWATFFRTRVVFDEQLVCEKDCMNLTLADIERQDPLDYREKMAYASYLATSPEATGLPGFRGTPA
jgi:hypothetical protein